MVEIVSVVDEGLAADDGGLDRGRVLPGPVTVMCGHGERAMTAASIFQAAGHDELAVLTGGPGDWSAAASTPLATR